MKTLSKIKNMFSLGKKGQIFSNVTGLVVGLVSLTILMAVAFVLLAEVGDNTSVAADANATEAVNTLTNAAADIPGWMPLIVLAVIGAILIGLTRLFRN